MKSSYKKIFVSLIVMLVFILGIGIKTSASSFDYSRKDSLNTVNISAVDLIEMITKEKANDYDIKYYQDNDYLLYEGKVSSDRVITKLEGNTLTVQASSYDYTSVKGENVKWVPYQVKLNNKDYLFENENGEYKCIINNVSESEDSISVTYKLSLTLDKDNVNDLINGAYNLANYYVVNDIVSKEETKYQTAYNNYLKDKAAYSNYLTSLEQYELKMVEYKKYLNEVKEYNEKLAKYNEYLSELAKYNEELKAYNDYIYNVEHYDENLKAYNNYLIEKAKYDEEYNAYLEEYGKIASKRAYIDYGLGIMKLIETPMTSMGRTIYGAVMGDAVTQVLEQKDKLYTAGVSKKVIYQAEEATYKLREIFGTYYSLSGEENQYTYYKTNYVTLKKYMINLLQALERLYDYTLVKEVIDLYDKKTQYTILIAQLVLVCNAMNSGSISNYDGNGTFDSGWKIDGKTMDQVLENDYTWTKNDELVVPKVYYVESPVAPTPIKVVEKPVQPVEVSKPVPPVEVFEPAEVPVMKEPTKPKTVSKPVEPTPYKLDTLTSELISAYKSGELKKRTLFTKDVVLEREETFSKAFRNVKEVTVKFYDSNKEFLVSYTTDLGSYINYDISLPIKEADEEYKSYRFSHWEYEDGTILDMNNVSKEGLVYPVFVGEEKQVYTVTWKVNNDVYTESYEYGELPVFKEEIKEKYSGSTYEKFDLWDKDIDIVKGDITYTAQFKKEYLISNETSHANIKYTDEEVIINYRDNNGEIDVEKFFDLAVEEETSYKLKIVNSSASIVLNSIIVNSLKENNVSKIIVQTNMNNKYDYEFEVSFKDENGGFINVGQTLNVEFNGEFHQTKSNLYYEENGELVEVRAEITNDKVVVSNFNPNIKYYIFPTYKIMFESNEYGNVELDKTLSKAGEEIGINIDLLKEGTYIKEITLIDSEGNQTKIDSIESFAMPQSDVHMIVSYDYYTYTIEFSVDGETVSSKVYKYGDEVVLPPEPIKASDEEYSYKFVGWSEEVTSAYGDKTYVAIFETTEVEKPTMANGINLLLIGEIGLGCGLGIIVLVIVLKVIKKRRIA